MASKTPEPEAERSEDDHHVRPVDQRSGPRAGRPAGPTAGEADLHRAARTIALLARVLERAAGDLSLPQYRVLALVAAGDERATHLAGRLAITKPSVSAVVDGLVERGYLAREPVADDRRAVKLCITREGAAALAAAEQAMAERLEPLVDAVDDRAGFVDELDRIREEMRTRRFVRDAKGSQ